MTSPVLGTAAEYSPFQCLLLISLGSPNFNRGEADPSYNVHGRGLEDGDIYSRALDARDLDFEDTGLHTRGINADELGYLNKRDLHIRDLLEILLPMALAANLASPHLRPLPEPRAELPYQTSTPAGQHTDTKGPSASLLAHPQQE